MSSQPGRPRVGVSSCLLGELVRYDGQEKAVPWIADELAGHVEVVSICPEVGAGMGVPRPPIQIVDESERGLRLQVVSDGKDLTEAVLRFARTQLGRCESEPLDGYIFKARSPSCGLWDAPQFDSAAKDAGLLRSGAGIWAGLIRQRFADLPLIDESAVRDANARREFVARVRAHWLSRKIIKS